MNVINFAQPITGNFLVDLILWLVTSTGSVALGIVIFTVILKLITLPFDILSRRSMRKNSLLMEQMRPELERLQKQYSNNKELYNQKMMALYKKNGYSMWGSCLPTLLTLIIFIVAINGFTAYSSYQNRVYFYEMSKSYNSVIYDGFELDNDKIKLNEEGKLVIDDGYFYSKLAGSEKVSGTNISFVAKSGADGYTIFTENGFIKYTVTFKGNGEVESAKYELIRENLFNEKTFASSSKINSGFELDGTYIYEDVVKEEGKEDRKVIVFNNEELYKACPDNQKVEIATATHKVIVSKSNRTMEVYTENGYVSYKTDFIKNGEEVTFNEPIYTLNKSMLFNEKACALEGETLYFGLELDEKFITKGEKSYNIDYKALITETEKSETLGETKVTFAKTDLGYSLYTSNGYMKYFRVVTDGESGAQFNGVSFSIIEKNLDNVKNLDNKTYLEAKTENANLTAEDFIRDIQGEKAAKAFRSEMASFLWVKNIWITDGAHKHPVLEYEEFKTTVAETSGCGCSCNNEIKAPISNEEYDLLTAKLTEEKSTPNGFYILCILSALISLASQLIMSKSQKAQLELQTVDGQGASNQKMMTWMMPAMMAIFSFVYTSAFSIYIIINTTLGIGTTLIINKAVEKNFSKKNAKPNVVRGRVYVKKEEPIVDKKDRKVKKEKKEEPKVSKNDFLSGLADDKRPTKKIKRK